MAGTDGPGQPSLAGTDPVAVIGVGCRFAGGSTNPARYWEMLHAGRDGIGRLPEERWQAYADLGGDFAAALRRATRWGGFLSDIEGFDAEFFGLSPREAELMDPQQRLLLEVAWEALEHAGIPPQSLAATDAGVFVGVGSDDYGRRLLEDLPTIEAWTGIGSAMCAVANRISYALDLRGPSLAVDTACSASLVALHLACQSVRTGESPVALAAGVNLVISPGLTLTLDAAGATAPDGRCKSFDVTANGYGRGEGAGVLVLKRLSDARRDGDRVLATILGSAVNQDGRTNGIMAPNAEAQRHVLARACAQAGVDPRSVDYVEAHGTGTRLGDPLEASALSAVYGAGREPDQPCLIGSVKSNIGHLEAGAGVAGVIKAVLALGHGEIPPTLNHTTGNPAIDWDNAGLRVVTEPTAWPKTDHPRRAGVSAFGYGGTVAHLVLEQAPPPSAQREPATAGTAAEERLFPLSAASEAGLRQQAGELAAWLSGPSTEGTLTDVGYTLALRRSHLSHRAVVVAGDRDELVARLRRIADGKPGEGIASGVVASAPGKGLVWVFSGHGSQWTGMGRELLAAEPVFATVVDILTPIFLREIGFSPRTVLDEAELVEIGQIQTMIFVMQVGLAEVWRSYGVTPDAVIGHSVGEIAAAVVSGALTLEEGAVLICRRSRLLRRVAGQGAMAMVGLGFDEVARRLSGHADVVAAIASAPLSTVVAGEPAAVEELMGQWAAEDINVRRVASDVAFHSPHMEPLLADLAEAASGLSPASPRIPMYSTSMPEPCTTPLVDSAYWVANLRNPVRLFAAVQAAAEDGYRAFMEISSHPVVAHSMGEALADTYADAFIGTSLRRNQPERATLLANAGALYCHGIELDWARLQPVGELVTLPTVAWQRRQLWRDSRPKVAGLGLQHDGDSHTLLGAEVPVGGHSMRLWRTLLDESCRPYPGSHTINGVEIIPAAVLINTFARAAADGAGMPVLKDVSLRVPLPDTRREIQVSYADGVLRLASQAQAQDGDAGIERPWLVHTSALVVAPHAVAPLPVPDSPKGTAEDPGSVLQHLASVGVPTMAYDWTVEELHRHGRGLRARVLAEQPDHVTGSWAPMLDAALSVAPVADPVPALRMVAGVREVRIVGEPPETAVIDIVVNDAGTDTVDVWISDEHGVVLATLTGLHYAGMQDVAAGSVAPQHLVHEAVWRELELPAADGQAYRREVVLVSADAQVAGDWQKRLSAAGAAVRVVPGPAELGGLVPAPGASTDVLLLPSVSGDTAAEAATRATWLLASTAQHLGGGPPVHAPRLWCLTTGVRDGHTGTGLALAPLWGLGRVLRNEHPELWGGTVDVAHGDDVPADVMLRLFGAAPAEDVVSFRDGAVEVSRLTAVDGAPTLAPFTCRSDATYLVTGGLGALGLEVAQWLAERGARRLVLTGRRALPPRVTWDKPADDSLREQIKVVRDLEALGVTVRSVALDMADAERAAAVLDTDALGLPPIRGVVHAAGVLDNRMLADVDEESVRTVMRPKAAGAWTLHELFPPGTLDFFVLFSSCGQLLGLPGQSTYGPANVFLDALAAFRQATDGDVTLSLGWTSWRSKGMSVNEVVDLELRARGVAAISVREAFDAWDWAHRHGAAQFTVLRVLPVEPGMERPVVLSETVAGADAGDATEAASGQMADFSGLTPEALHSRLLVEVTERIVAEMRMSTEDLDPRRSLSEQGLDSVMTIVVRRSLESRFGRVLPATLLWHQPTVTAIADHLTELLISDEEDRVATAGVLS